MNVFILFLKVVAIFLGIIFLLFLMIIFTPCEYGLNADIKDENACFHVEMTAVLHLLKFKISIENSECKIKLIVFGRSIHLKFNKRPHGEKKLKSRKDKINFLNKDFLAYCIAYFKEICAILKPKRMDISGTYWFDDPAQTGILCGIVSIFSQMVKGDCLHINLEPDFENQVIDIYVNIYGRFILFCVILKTFKFIMKDEVREVLIEKS